MHIAVIGGRGRLGAAVVTELERRGHTPRVLSRSASEHPVDLTTGAGLDGALAGVEVVVDAVNETSSKHGRAVLVAGTRRLLAAEARAGVRHHVELGIVGAEQVPLAYYAAKVEQLDVVRGGPVPWTIVRATQFHELLAWGFASAARWRVLPGGAVPVQPVAAADVAQAVAEAALTEPRHGVVTVAGPAIEPLGALASAWSAATGTRAVRIPVPPVTRATRALRAGALTTDTPDLRGTTTFSAWLKTHV